METTSARGLDYSTTEPAVAAALDDFTDRLLHVDPGAERILTVVQDFPHEAGLRVAAAFFFLFGQTPDAQREADDHLAEARRHLSRLNARERAWVRGLELWQQKAFDAAATAFEEITRGWPQDLLGLRAAEFLYYVLGQQYSGPRFIAHTERMAPLHGDDSDFLAIHAFANELCGHMHAARTHADRALALRAGNPWAQHALAHVLLWEGNTDSAAKLMDGWLAQWPLVARAVHCHNAWHVAVMHLDRLENDRAYAVYDAHVWGKTPEYVVEQLDAIAFLWRAEMAGVAVDAARWHSILPYIRPVCTTLFMPFATAHYAYALARGGDTATVAALLAATQARAADDDAEAVQVWQPVGRHVVNAAAALGAGDAHAAAASFDAAMPAITRIGGSDAQDDLFRFAYIDSLKRADRRADAAAFLNERLARKRASPLETQLLAALN